ncbi:unnamed protein product [Prorocentrum cordatum]|uniref:Uncharacterized protein n=1 Tax=Prorocentrum cordatum TaxID=2364126 RepID=A0ABN9S5P1_9DINO|nr:unnamed protein product [Polarella glacialis]
MGGVVQRTGQLPEDQSPLDQPPEPAPWGTRGHFGAQQSQDGPGKAEPWLLAVKSRRPELAQRRPDVRWVGESRAKNPEARKGLPRARMPSYPQSRDLSGFQQLSAPPGGRSPLSAAGAPAHQLRHAGADVSAGTVQAADAPPAHYLQPAGADGGAGARAPATAWR